MLDGSLLELRLIDLYGAWQLSFNSSSSSITVNNGFIEEIRLLNLSQGVVCHESEMSIDNQNRVLFKQRS